MGTLFTYERQIDNKVTPDKHSDGNKPVLVGVIQLMFS